MDAASMLEPTIMGASAPEKKRPMPAGPDHHKSQAGARRGSAIARLLVTGAAWVVLFIAVTGAAHAAEKLSIRLDWITEPMHMPFFLAEERGWFKAADLDVSIEDGNGSTMTVQLVGAGRFDIGLADLSPMAIGKARGIPIVYIAGFIRRAGVG